MIIAFIHQYKEASRQDVDDLLLDKLSNAWDERKKKYVTNLLYEMSKRDGVIINKGSTRLSKWMLT